MSYQVIQVPTSVLIKLKEFYHPHQIEKLPSGAVFAAKSPQCMITAYKSGKVLFQGKSADEEAAIWREFGGHLQLLRRPLLQSQSLPHPKVEPVCPLVLRPYRSSDQMRWEQEIISVPLLYAPPM